MIDPILNRLALPRQMADLMLHHSREASYARWPSTGLVSGTFPTGAR